MALERDCEFLFQLVNTDDVREASFNQDPIDRHTHTLWFGNKLRDPQCYMYICMTNDNNPVGQIRFDICNAKEAYVGISISPSAYGLGLGNKIIRQGTDLIFKQANVATVIALVKTSNIRSKKAFLKAGYQEDGMAALYGIECIRLVRSKY